MLSPENQGAAKPELLTEGFLDHQCAEDKLVSGHKFLVLGHKGSGKSAIAERLRLKAATEHDCFTRSVHLGDFPFKSFGQIMAGKAEPEAKYPTTWSWLLLLLLMDSLGGDCGVTTDPGFSRSLGALRDMRLLPADDLKQVVIKSSKKTFKAHIPKLLEIGFENSEQPGEMDLQLIHLVEQLKVTIAKTGVRNRHILILDGLDDILTSRKIQYDSISALIFQADRLNLYFMQRRIGCKVLVLCRTDLFEKLPGPNKNKLRQDSAFELDWYHDPREPKSSQLISLVNLRASMALGREVDLLGEYFPRAVKAKPIESFLLANTRHTPRDFIQLMNHLKKYAKSQPLTKSQVLSGSADYSKNYFLPEVRDEMVGYVDEQVFDDFMKILGSFRTIEVPYWKLVKQCSANAGISEDVVQVILKNLFNCSAVGNKWQRGGSEPRYYYKYRNRHATISFEDSIHMHTGMWKALGLI